MSALARYFLHEGKEVSGSDQTSSAITESLMKEGAKIFTSQVADNITPDIDLVVYTEAMSKDQEEMVAAKELKAPMINYFEALGLVVNNYYLIAVAGTHGKTTTTAMLTDVLEEAEVDPTAIIGSLRSKTGSNFRAGKSKYAVVEACEYKRDFLHLEPDILVITNVELEHVDYYKDLTDVQQAFRELALKVPETGFIVADNSQENIKPILEGVQAKVIDYRQFVDLINPMLQPGMHNRLNAGAAKVVSDILEVEDKVSKEALSNFAGTWRRFEYKGKFMSNHGEGVVYDDYAHHPTEIIATISGVRELYPKQHLTVVFQPHTYTRTKELFGDFAEALAKADRVIMLPIYKAREEEVSEINSRKLAIAVIEKGVQAGSVDDVDRVIGIIKNDTPEGGVVVTMGAGDMTSKVAEGLV